MGAVILALLEHPDHHNQIRAGAEQARLKIVVVDSFPKAQVLLMEQSFDLIISDVHLENGGTVFDFLKWVKSDPDLNAIPFVLLSVEPTKLAKYLADGVRTVARMFGAARFITLDKFDGAILAQELAELLPPAETEVPLIVQKEGE